MDYIKIIDNSGNLRDAYECQCDACGKKFLRMKRFKNKGKHKFCSRKCSNEYRRLGRIEVSCANCGKVVKRNPSKLRNSRSGIYFCSRICKDKAQRIGGIREIMPSHYGTISSDYRTAAFRKYKHVCSVCGYDKHEEALIVHHIDHNRKNNSIDNLIILCYNCHVLVHCGKLSV